MSHILSRQLSGPIGCIDRSCSFTPVSVLSCYCVVQDLSETRPLRRYGVCGPLRHRPADSFAYASPRSRVPVCFRESLAV